VQLVLLGFSLDSEVLSESVDDKQGTLAEVKSKHAFVGALHVKQTYVVNSFDYLAKHHVALVGKIVLRDRLKLVSFKKVDVVEEEVKLRLLPETCRPINRLLHQIYASFCIVLINRN